MNAGGETADQIVKMSLQGIEVAANVALKAGGTATKSLAAFLYAVLTDKKKVKGKARLQSMLKSGKELKVYAFRNEDLKYFCSEAKKYGVLYNVVKEHHNKVGICDVIVRAEDASKIAHILDKLELATIDTKAISEAVKADRSSADPSVLKESEITPMSEKDHDDLVGSLMDAMKEKKPLDPSQARKNKNPLSEPTLKKAKTDMGTSERKSVRDELNSIKALQKNKSTNMHGKETITKSMKKER